MLALRILSFLLGLYIVAISLNSIIRTFVLPRSAPDWVTRKVFLGLRSLFNLRARFAASYLELDGIFAMYGPLAVLTLLPVSFSMLTIGYMFLFWGVGVPNMYDAFILSGSSLFTLGFSREDNLILMTLTFSASALGLILAALLIAYLPTMYSAFQRREYQVNLFTVRAGTPPSALEMILRYYRLNGMEGLANLTDTWITWEQWFADIEESHTSLAALVFFRSPKPNESWVNSGGALLDAAALIASTVDVPRDVRAELCLRAGFLAFRNIADFFRVQYPKDPHFPETPISICREEYDEVCDQMEAVGVRLKPDRDQTWQDFAGWRVNYDAVLLALCSLTLAPPAPWSSDRAPQYMRPEVPKQLNH